MGTHNININLIPGLVVEMKRFRLVYCTEDQRPGGWCRKHKEAPMNREPTIQIHFIDEKNNGIVLKQLARHVPRVGDEIRFGGEGNEKYYRVMRVIWVYDEREVPAERVNIGVVDCT